MAISKKLRRLALLIARTSPRRVPVAPVHYAINERAILQRIVEPLVENGRIGICRVGVDCDCSSYHYESVRPYRGAFALLNSEDDHRESLDGTERTSFLRPSEVDQRRNGSRDLALEAFEDGHPHVVYA